MNTQTNSNMIIYNDGELELNVSVENETIWLTQKQLGELFHVESHNITYHIKNIYKQKELEKNSTTRKIRVVQKEGNSYTPVSEFPLFHSHVLMDRYGQTN